jgi:RNA polymerase-binding transcription factor DksA
MLSQEFINEMKQKLAEEKQKLEEELSGLHKHTELGDDVDSSVEEIEIDEVSSNVMARIKADLEKIANALGKIEAGTYGTDDEGNEIPEERLRVLPWADKAL